jgi:hypothetical protein
MMDMSGIRKGRVQERIKTLEQARDLIVAQYNAAIGELSELLKPEETEEQPAEQPEVLELSKK